MKASASSPSTGTRRTLALGMIGAVIGIVANQAVARYKLVTGRRIGSATLIADAKHSWLDALSSAGALAGLIAVALGQPWGDPVAGPGDHRADLPRRLSGHQRRRPPPRRRRRPRTHPRGRSRRRIGTRGRACPCPRPVDRADPAGRDRRLGQPRPHLSATPTRSAGTSPLRSPARSPTPGASPGPPARPLSDDGRRQGAGATSPACAAGRRGRCRHRRPERLR